MTNDFEWPVAAGYEWRRVIVTTPIRRAGEALRPIGEPVRTYSPLKACPDLYRKFARLEPTTAAFRDFAARYGLLGVAAETDDQWFDEHLRVWQTVGRLDAIRGRTAPDTLAYFVYLVPRTDTVRAERVRAVAHASGGVDQSAIRAGRAKARRIELDALTTAFVEHLNGGLARHAGPPHVEPHRGTTLRPLFTTGHQPTSLIGAIWTQCLWAATGTQEVRTCLWCDRRIAKHRRSDANFCDPRIRHCRVLFNNTRRAEAAT